MNISADTTKGVGQLSTWNISHVNRTVRFVALFIGIILALTMSGQPALAADSHDQLYLTGVIKSINAVTGIVTVDVASSICRGMRIFKADDLDKLEDYLEQSVSFFIDSNKCEIKDTYTIITARGLRK